MRRASLAAKRRKSDRRRPRALTEPRPRAPAAGIGRERVAARADRRTARRGPPSAAHSRPARRAGRYSSASSRPRSDGSSSALIAASRSSAADAEVGMDGAVMSSIVRPAPGACPSALVSNHHTMSARAKRPGSVSLAARAWRPGRPGVAGVPRGAARVRAANACRGRASSTNDNGTDNASAMIAPRKPLTPTSQSSPNSAKNSPEPQQGIEPHRAHRAGTSVARSSLLRFGPDGRGARLVRPKACHAGIGWGVAGAVGPTTRDRSYSRSVS